VGLVDSGAAVGGVDYCSCARDAAPPPSVRVKDGRMGLLFQVCLFENESSLSHLAGKFSVNVFTLPSCPFMIPILILVFL
jgi:hypothetical protein